MFAFVFVFVMIIFLPWTAIKATDVLGLPVMDNPFLKFLGIILILIEVITTAQTFYFFSKYGKGSPIITEGTNKFVERGLHRFLRNPMYLGHVCLLLGMFLILGHIMLFAYALLLFIKLNVLVIKWEEPHLRKKFGKTYIEYTKKVKRWGLF